MTTSRHAEPSARCRERVRQWRQRFGDSGGDIAPAEAGESTNRRSDGRKYVEPMSKLNSWLCSGSSDSSRVKNSIRGRPDRGRESSARPTEHRLHCAAASIPLSSLNRECSASTSSTKITARPQPPGAPGCGGTGLRRRIHQIDVEDVVVGSRGRVDREGRGRTLVRQMFGVRPR